MKAGYRTTEFWMSAVGGLVVAALALLVGYGAITSEQSDLWAGLILAAAPLAIAYIAGSYNKSRAEVKAGE